MAKQRFLNNFDWQFIATVKDAPDTGVPDTELGYGIIQINGSAAPFIPALTNGDWYMLTAFKKTGSVQSDIEVLKVLGVNEPAYIGGGETRLRVLRAQEDTVAKSYAVSDYVSMRFTKSAASNFMQISEGLASLTDIPASRTKLGLGTAALLNSGVAAGNVILGNDTRLTDTRVPKGSAGGVLSGTYPNPTFANDMATQGELDIAIATREPSVTGGTSSQFWRGDKVFAAITKADLGLGNVDNTSNATERAAIATITNKTISAANNNIVTAPSGNLGAESLNLALAELQSDIDTRAVNSSVATSLNLKANLISPVFTGTPLAPTASLGDSTSKLATTEFVALNSAAFISGTRTVFQQSTAPTGWSKDTNAALNDSILRIVTGPTGSGGVTPFSTFNGQVSVGATTLSTAQIPSHAHSAAAQATASGAYSAPGIGGSTVYRMAGITGYQGGGGSHTHTLTHDIKYNDFIICEKD